MTIAKSYDPTPSPPNITKADLLRQIWLDIFGKEVQSAATYSYLWMAVGLGHIALGLILSPVATFLIWGGTGLFAAKPVANPELIALIVVSVIFSFWEWRAYQASVKAAKGIFPLDRKLLRANALVATGYMVIGAVAGYAFQVDWEPAVPLVAAMVVLSVLLVPPWLRQKIIWQKASLPYLFRLADARKTIDQSAANAVQALIDADVPPDAKARQIIVLGPIGSGRTPLVTGIGTEFAFKGRKVRYLTFATMLEIAEQLTAQTGQPEYPSVPGPVNITYWPWWTSQVLILDDISPVVLTAVRSSKGNSFKNILNTRLEIVAEELATRHTVWVFGEDNPSASDGLLEELAKDVQIYCKSDKPPILVRLSKIKD